MLASSTNVSRSAPVAHPPRTRSLDLPTLLVPGGDYVALTLYPDAGEATLVHIPRRSDKPRPGELELENAAPRNRDLDSALRARGEIRRSIRRNRGRFLWTLTFAEATYDVGAVAVAVAAFLVRLRETFGRIWFIAVPEPHPGGHGWHVHGAANRFLPIEKVWACWQKGWCWVGDHNHANKTMATRKLAGYLAKYVTKVIAGCELYGCQPRRKGQHRYYVTQGFEPQRVSKAFRTIRQGLLWLLKHYGVWDMDGDLPGERDIPVVGVWLRFPDRYCRPLLQGP